MNGEEICQRVIEMCRKEGATDVVASIGESEETMVRFSNNEITVIDDLDQKVCSIFVKVEARKAGTTVEDLSQPSLRTAARKVVAAARNSPPADAYVPLPKGPFRYDPELRMSPPVTTDLDVLVSWTRGAIDAGLKEGAERMAGSLIASNGTYTMATSGDVAASSAGGSLEISLRAFGKDHASGHSVSISPSDGMFSPERAGAEAGEYARLSASPVKGEPGSFRTILGPLAFAGLMNQFGRVSSAFLVDSGMSFLGGKVGQKLAPEWFYLYDDASMPNTYGSSAFDAEGLPTRRTEIIEDGVLKSYLHNSVTAQKYGTGSTANAGLVAPRPFNLEVSPGTKELDELIAEVDSGIMVTNAWYLRYQNYSTGDFSVIPRDAMFLIKKGEVAGSLKELRISENMLRLVGGIQEASRERKWIKWWEVRTPTLSPSVLVGDVRFTRSEI